MPITAYDAQHGPGGNHRGCVQRCRRAAAARDPRRPRGRRAPRQRPRAGARGHAAADVQASARAARGRGGRGARRGPSAAVLAERLRAEADPRLGQDLRAHVVRAVRAARRRAPRAEGDGMTATVTLPTEEQILITREFDAPRHLVYRAWTTPELVRRWWSGRRGEMQVVEIDLRVGGAWRYVTVATGGYEVGFHGEFREIVPGERMVTPEIYEGAPEQGEPP